MRVAQRSSAHSTAYLCVQTPSSMLQLRQVCLSRTQLMCSTSCAHSRVVDAWSKGLVWLCADVIAGACSNCSAVACPMEDNAA